MKRSKQLIVAVGIVMKYNKMISCILKRNLQGGALYIAMMVGIIIGILLTMFILLARYNNYNVTAFAQNSQLQYNLKSAFQIARSSYFTPEKNDRWIKNSFNDDSIKVKRAYWGAYLLVTAQTKNRHHAISQSALFGSSMSRDTGLVVSDNGRPIGLSGSVIFKANCYLPSAGIKPAFIEGQSYMGGSQNAAFIKKASLQMPVINEKFKKAIYDQQKNLVSNNDSIIGLGINSFERSFSRATVLIEMQSNKMINYHLKGNIKIICNSELVMDSSCHLDDVLVIAHKVRFKQGFKGSVHVIASDSIIAEKRSVFEYPSSFVLAPGNEKENSLKCIQMNEDTQFNGGMIAFSESENQDSKVFVKLNARGEVNGFIYSSDYLHSEGKINANVICNKLMLKTPSAVYENHLLACEIDPGKYSHLLSIPNVFSKESSLMLCKNFGK